MKRYFLGFLLMTLSGCSMATKDSSVGPLINHKPVVTAASFDEDRQCGAIVDRDLFLACKGGYIAVKSRPRNTAQTDPASERGSSFYPFYANPGGTKGPQYVHESEVRKGGYPGNCLTPNDLDSKGNKCGDRSAQSRPGGY
jgi:hypothetical protein